MIMPVVYPSLHMGARARLAMFKREAAKPNWVRPMTWRDVRFAKLTITHAPGQGQDGGKPIWYVHNAPHGYFRREEFAHEVMRSRHTGYYTDCDYSELAQGIIVALPHGRFIAGYYWGGNGERVYYPEIYTDKGEAARAADGHAESFAEDAREDSYKYREASNLQMQVEEKIERLRECLALAQIGHKREAMRDEARELIGEIRETRETLKSKYADYL